MQDVFISARAAPRNTLTGSLHSARAVHHTEAGQPPAEYWGRRLAILSVICFAASFILGFALMAAVLILICSGAAVLGLRKPALGLLAISMLSVLEPLIGTQIMVRGPVYIPFNIVNYLLLGVIVLSFPFLLRLTDVHTRLLQFFSLWLILGLLVTPDLATGQQNVLVIITTFGLVTYFARACDEERMWYWLGVVCGVLGVVVGLAFYMQADRLPYANPNSWGFVPLTALIALCLGFTSAQSIPRGQAIIGLLSVVNFVWVFLSTSRGHLLVAVWCLLYLLSQIKGVSYRLLIVLGVLLFSLWLSADSSEYSPTKLTTLQRVTVLFDSSATASQRTSGRSELVLAGWYIFQDHPLGVGTGGFAATLPSVSNRSGLTKWLTNNAQKTRPAHAGWVKTLSENGIIGMIILASFVVSFAVVGWRKRKEGLFSLGLLTTGFLALNFVSQEYSGKGPWLLVVATITFFYRKEIQAHLRDALRRTPITSVTRSSASATLTTSDQQ